MAFVHLSHIGGSVFRSGFPHSRVRHNCCMSRILRYPHPVFINRFGHANILVKCFDNIFDEIIKEDDDYDFDDESHDTNWFVVTEPGINVEINVFKWMRLCPGISYRAAFGSEGMGLEDQDINGTSMNVSLKFGKF